MTQRDPLLAVRQMRHYAHEATQFAHGRCRADLDTDRTLGLALLQLLSVIGRASDNVPEDIQARHSAVPWKDLADRGNQLLRCYDTINFDIVWAVIQDELPPLVKQLDTILVETADARTVSA